MWKTTWCPDLCNPEIKKIFQPTVCIWFIVHWVMNSNVLLDKITMLPADVYGNGILKLVIWRDESLSQTDKSGHITTRDFQKKKRNVSVLKPSLSPLILP